MVLKPSGDDENRHNHYPHPDVARHAGVLLARKVSERQLFLQVCARWPCLSAAKGVLRYSVPKWQFVSLINVGNGCHCLRRVFSCCVCVCVCVRTLVARAAHTTKGKQTVSP